MISPFDYAKSIDTRIYIDDITGYVPFIINRKLSFAKDTILYANEMNITSWLDNKLQYDYFFYSIRPNKHRPFTKWLKSNKEDDTVLAIMEYYGYNRQKAKQVVTILSADQIKIIKTSLIRGGMT